MRKRKSFADVLWLCVLLALLLVMVYSGLRILESTVLYHSQEPVVQQTSKTVVREGREYFPRQDITTVMVLGIDQFGPVESSNYYRNQGAADSVILLVFDETNQECTALYLNRDTMLEMDVLGVRGEYAGTFFGQLALAHTYGTGLEDSCENVKNTLMNFIHGLTVDYYVAMNMDAIPIVNDAVGGVTVTVTDDFSKVNPSITMGRLTLRGDQVLDYVRTRKDVGDQKNVTRMKRQQEYVEGFLNALYATVHGEPEFFLHLYDALAPYIVTDCSSTTLSAMLDRYADYTLVKTLTLQGENVVEDGHYAFYVDEEKLDELIIQTFYAPKN